MENNVPLVSVLIPVYNVECFVKEAILSICNQTYKNLDIIVVDDCSTDSTYEILESISKSDSRVRIFRNNINLKIVETLNFALSHAKGDYIARMDGDDISALDRIEKQLNFLLKHPEFQLVGCQILTVNTEGDNIGKLKRPISQNNINKIILLSSPVLHLWLARKAVYDILGGYRKIPGAEDYDFLLRMYSAGLLFTNVESYDYSVRIRDGNTTTTIGFQQRLMSDYAVELYEERKLSGSMNDSFSDTSVEEFISINEVYRCNFNKSNICLQKAIALKSKKNYFLMAWNLFLALALSRLQFKYVVKSSISKISLILFK